MSLVLNEEQTILKRAAHEFFAERMPVSALRKLRDDGGQDGFDRAAWRDMVDMGWAGILIPEDFGGAGFGHKGFTGVLEASGRVLAASPLLSSALLGASVVLAAGNEAQKKALLTAVARGECVLALALEESPRHQPHTIETRVERNGDGYVVNGAKYFVFDGHVADRLIVVARSSGSVTSRDGITLCLVARDAPGLTVTRTTMVDARNAANIVFDGVQIGVDAILGDVEGGYAALEPALDAARVGLAAEMLGGGLEAFERTLAYLKMREQFDVPIGSFQALKHRAALMFCELELTRSAVLAAANALDEDSATRAELASLAKAKACDMLELVSNEAVQMHGGIGMTDAEEIGLFLKRARVQQQAFGDASFHRDRYATLKGF